MRVRFSTEEYKKVVDVVMEIKAIWFFCDEHLAFSDNHDYWFVSKNRITETEYDEIADLMEKYGSAYLDKDLFGTFEIKFRKE